MKQYKQTQQSILNEISKVERELCSNSKHFAGLTDVVDELICWAYRSLNPDHYRSALRRLDAMLDKVENQTFRLSLKVSVYRNMLELRHVPVTEQLDLWLAIARNFKVLQNPTEALQAARTAWVIGRDLTDSISKRRVSDALDMSTELEGLNLAD